MKILVLAAMLLATCAACMPAQNAGTATAPAPQTAPVAQTKSWLIRLIPPRSTFNKDMTEQEAKLMDDHYAYWKQQFAQGVCVFGGPVLDPKGVYGVLAVRAATEDNARAIAAADPSVRGGIMHVEVAEMVIAFLPSAPAQP